MHEQLHSSLNRMAAGFGIKPMSRTSHDPVSTETLPASVSYVTSTFDPQTVKRGELICMSAIAFLVYYSDSMIAPLIPALARGFGVRPGDLKWLVAGFSMLYGASTLFYGVLSDRFGRYPVLRSLLISAAAAMLLLSFAATADQLILLRLLCAAGTGGIATIALSVIGDHYPYAAQGRPMGWMFGSIAAGMGLGSSLGPLLNSLLGWRNEARILGFGFIVGFVWITLHFRKHLHPTTPGDSLWAYASEYLSVIEAPRGGRTLALIFANGAFHGGIFAWLGVLLARTYHFDETRIGLVLAGYGLPDLLLGLSIGSWGDRFGRRYIVPVGFWWGSLCALLLAVPSTPLISAFLIAALSAGYDATHPLMSSVTTSLDPRHRGQITGLATFANFVGMGIGALMFQRLMMPRSGVALISFSGFEFAGGILAFYAFRTETPGHTRPRINAAND